MNVQSTTANNPSKAMRLVAAMGLAIALIAAAFALAATTFAQEAIADSQLQAAATGWTNFQSGDYEFQSWKEEDGTYSSTQITGYKGKATQLQIPTTFTVDGKSYGNGDMMIAAGAFKGNANIQKVAIPSGVEMIGEEAFANCSSLTEVAIQDMAQNSTYISAGVFAGCENLKTYRIDGTTMANLLNGTKTAINTDPRIGQKADGTVYPDVTVYTKKGSDVDLYIQMVNDRSTKEGGNTITLVYQDDPYSQNTVKPDSSSGSSDNGGSSSSGNNGGSSGGNNGGSSGGNNGGSSGGNNEAAQVGKDGTPYGEGASQTTLDKAITKYASETDPKGTVFGLLKAKIAKVAKNSVKLTWSKVKGAKKYVVYANKCGKKAKMVKQLTTTKTSQVFKKVNKAAVKKGTYYKFVVVALNAKGKVVSTSKFVHAATPGGKVGNDKKVTTAAKKNKVAIKAKKSFKLKAKAVPQSKKLKVQRHRKVNFESSNPKVAKVSAKGVIKGVKKGKCIVYAYAQNGICAQIKVTVK